MDWNILGIAPTRNQKEITAAYRARLKLTNPEDDPDGFKALRAAYEEAIRLAKEEQQPAAADESPLGLWKRRLEALYFDFRARLDPGSWKALLSDDVCIGLDTRPLAEEALLHFLMEHYFLPRNVWQVLDEVFAFSSRAEELSEMIPREYVEQVILNGIRLEPALPYGLFEPGINGADCDAYRGLYHQTLRMPPQQQDGILKQMEALTESHPYGRALRLRWLMENGSREEGMEGFRALAASYPAEVSLNLDWSMVCMEAGDTQQAEEAARYVLTLAPDQIHAKRIVAECMAAGGQLHEAKELVYEMMYSAGDDPILLDQCAELLRGWNEALILRRRAAMEQDPGDSDNAIELAWCYLQNEQPEDALKTAEQIDPECPDQFAYHNLLGKIYHNMERFADALPHLEQAEQLIRRMEPDGTDKTARRMRRLPEMLQVQGICLLQLQQEQQARRKLELALELAPEDTRILTLMGQILYSTGDYEGCAANQQRLLQVSPGSWFANVMLSMSLQKLNRDSEAFDAVNRALAVQGGDLSLYIIKMQILLRNGVYDEVHAILDFLRESGVQAHITLDWISAQLTELEEKDEKKAFGMYQAIARRIEGGEDMMDAADLYYRMALLMGKQMDDDRQEDRHILLAMLDKGLEQDKYHSDCLSFKALLLQHDGRLDEAVDMYRSLHTPEALHQLASLYFSDLNRYAAEAMELYEALLQQRQTAELYFYAATCRRHLGDLEGARQYYERELDIDPDDVDAYNGLAYIYEARKQYDEALAQIGKAMEAMGESGNFYDWIPAHRAQILCRMGRFDQALAAAAEALDCQNHPSLWQVKFDICCQFGHFDEARAVLDQWKQAYPDDPAQAVAAGRLHLLTGKMFRAAMAMGKAKHRISYDQEMDFRLQLADLECNLKRKLQLCAQRAEQSPGESDVLGTLALAQWWTGDRGAAVYSASKALALIDETLEGYLVDEAMYRTRRSVLLAILGREAEARAELAAARQLPLCQYCTYGSCKDADIYEAYIEEITGNTARALELHRAGREKWPDELDFVSGELRILKKKGK